MCTYPFLVKTKNANGVTKEEYIYGLKTANITEIAIYGENDEDTESLRSRYFGSFEEKAYGGNKKDYQDKTLAISGIGAVKVSPVWNGAGTVKLTILSSVFGKASNTLIENVQNIFDPNKNGMGDGIAPIGHIVTVDTVTEVAVNINATITYDNGYNWATCREQINAAVEKYLLSLRKEWSDSTELVVRIAQIDAAMLSVQGVIDVTGTTVNSKAQNLTLTDFEIPILGVISNA